MDLIFNELSTFHQPNNKQQGLSVLVNFVKVCKQAREEGFRKVRAENTFWTQSFFQNESISNFVNNLHRTYSSFLRSYIRPPFIAEGDDNEDDSYILNDYLFNEDDAGELKNEKITGLAYAYLFDTIAISLRTYTVWDKAEIKIIEKSESQENIIFVKHISKLSHFTYHEKWLENKQPIRLIKTKIVIQDKCIKLRDDHGKDALQAFSEKIRQSSYVIKIINSLPFNPREQNFVKQCYPNGQIELVLTKTDQGLGLIIQTTGRNLNETKLIAQKLWDRYYT